MNWLQVDSIRHMQLLGEHSRFFRFYFVSAQTEFKIEMGIFICCNFVVVCAVLTIGRPLNSEEWKRT